MAVLARWIHLRAAPSGPVVAADVDGLLADWSACYQELIDLAPGPERDAVAARCVRLGKAYQLAFRRLAPGTLSERV